MGGGAQGHPDLLTAPVRTYKDGGRRGVRNPAVAVWPRAAGPSSAGQSGENPAAARRARRHSTPAGPDRDVPAKARLPVSQSLFFKYAHRFPGSLPGDTVQCAQSCDRRELRAGCPQTAFDLVSQRSRCVQVHPLHWIAVIHDASHLREVTRRFTRRRPAHRLGIRPAGWYRPRPVDVEPHSFPPMHPDRREGAGRHAHDSPSSAGGRHSCTSLSTGAGRFGGGQSS
jgi:hypothetical protein